MTRAGTELYDPARLRAAARDLFEGHQGFHQSTPLFFTLNSKTADEYHLVRVVVRADGLVTNVTVAPESPADGAQKLAVDVFQLTDDDGALARTFGTNPILRDIGASLGRAELKCGTDLMSTRSLFLVDLHAVEIDALGFVRTLCATWVDDGRRFEEWVWPSELEELSS